MVSTRTTARGLLALALFGLAAGSAAATPPSPPPPRPPHPAPTPSPKPRKQIVFPVLGAVQFSDDFGAPRAQGPHQGIDILAPRRALALAAEAGRVRFETGSRRAGCMLYLDGRSGTTYVYIHLNNDLTDRNDNRGGCVNGVAFPRSLRTGARVLAGQPVGFVGDSGDADGGATHLHFERHPGGGRATNPYPYLIAAQRLLFYAPATTIVSLTLTGTVVSVREEALRVRVATLRVSPTGLVLRRLGRSVTVTVPSYTSIERGSTASATTLAGARRGERVSVWTEPETVTREAQAGMSGALTANRVLLPTAP